MVYVNCVICGRDDWRLRFPATVVNGEGLDVDVLRCTCAGYGEHLQIVQCLHCGHTYANPVWDVEELVQTYEAVEDATYLRERAARRRTFQSRLELLERHHDPALGRTLLDVGAYTGVFVEVARTAEWDAMGVEPSHWAIQVARDARLPVIQGTLLSPELVGRQFDAITMWDVIEHVSNPREELQRSYNLLAPGGLLLVHTMDIDSLTAKIMGSSWPWLMDMHLHYFSRQRLIWLLRDCGYEVVWHGTQGRFLSLGYLSSRLSAFNDGFAQRLGTLLRRLKLETVLMPVNFGDLFTVLARRPR